MESRKNEEFWARLLGEDVARTMDEERNGELYQEVMEQKEGVLKPLYQLFDSVVERVDWEGMEGEFRGFYGWFFSVALSYAEKQFQKLFDICQDAKAVLLYNVYEAVKMIPIRCLIWEIHRCKEDGKLKGYALLEEKSSDAMSQEERRKGTASQEEYHFYDTHMLGDIAYVRDICQKYPELLRLMLVKIDWTVRELACIAEAVEADEEEIRELFCAGRPFSKVRMITCALSDTHRGGKTVAEVALDNGVRIFYKPRSLQKENEYQRAYEWFGRKLGIETYCMKRICRKDYGWEERIEREECDSEEAVRRYFYRLGMQLCLCYLVNGSDLHGENIMAKGEFPVIVDMETCSGNRRRGGENEQERQNVLSDFLQDGVSRTGILPIPVWGRSSEEGTLSGSKSVRTSSPGGRLVGASSSGGRLDGVSPDGVARGINVSALHKAEKITAPFRLPVIEHAGTSDIAVAYRKGELELPDSLPYLRGKPVDAAGHRRELVAGFVDAYRLVWENKEDAEALLRPLWQSESRYVARHTQQYSMYLFTSLHPDFMKSAKERIRFLHVLRKTGAGVSPDDEGRELFWQELRDMINMDIPYFSCKGDSLSLVASDGTEIPRFFVASAFEEGKRKFKRLGEADLQRQMMLISYSLLMLGEGDETDCSREMPGMAYVGKMRPLTEERSLEAVRGIAQTICRLRIDENGKEGEKDAAQGMVCDVGQNAACDASLCVTRDMDSDMLWPDLQFYGDGGWGVRPLGMDLYDGLPGVALFFAALSEKMPDASEREEYGRMFSRLCGQMFDYTDERERVEKTENMGMFVGESSLWYAYLLLWEIKKDSTFLEYAVKQERIVRERRGRANEADLLTGDAGCILCYLKMYECMAQYEEMQECGKASKRKGACPIQGEWTNKRRYLERAVDIGERLWERAEPQESGCGWTIRGESVPLAGMAHGNSGGIYAYAGLLEQTRNPIYVGRIRKLAEYEDTLYSDALGNWKDVRKQHADGRKGRNMVAWCHGAAGILLSRLKLDSLPEFQDDAFVKRDIGHAVAALKYGEIPDNICLCHGLAGNYLIIKWYLQKYFDKELEERGEVLLRLLVRRLEDGGHAAAQERNRVGLMCGLAGAGMVWII